MPTDNLPCRGVPQLLQGGLIRFGPYGLNPEGVRHRARARPRETMHWKTFLKAHWGAIAAADFFSVEVLTLSGLVRYWLLCPTARGKSAPAFPREPRAPRADLRSRAAGADTAYACSRARGLGLSLPHEINRQSLGSIIERGRGPRSPPERRSKTHWPTPSECKARREPTPPRA